MTELMKERGLTRLQQAFVEEYVKCCNAKRAAEAAGLKTPESSGSRMLKNPRVRAAVDSAGELRERLAQASAVAFQTLLELLEKGDTDTVRLRAAQDILDRAGFKPVDKREVTGTTGVVSTSVDYTDPEAVAARIAELKKRLEDGGGGSEGGRHGN